LTRYSLMRCNQCNARDAAYCKAADEYLCEECEAFALELIRHVEALAQADRVEKETEE
jgi:hypothetical protein